MFVLHFHECERTLNDSPCTFLFDTEKEAVARVMHYVCLRTNDEDIENVILEDLTVSHKTVLEHYKARGCDILNDEQVGLLYEVAESYFEFKCDEDVIAYCEILEFTDGNEPVSDVTYTLDTHSYCGVNIGHLPSNETKKLEVYATENADNMLWKRDTGVIVKLYEELEYNLKDDLPTFNSVVSKLHAQGHRMIDFDADAVVHDNMEFFD